MSKRTIVWTTTGAMLSALVLVPIAARAVNAASASRVPGLTTTRAGAVSSVVVVTDTATQTLSVSTPGDTGWVAFPGATAKVTVPSKWTSGLVFARFTAAGTGLDGADGLLRVLVDGVEANPVVDMNSRFFGTAAAIDRSVTVGPGKHVVQLQWRLFSTCQDCGFTSFSVGEWSLTAELARAN